VAITTAAELVRKLYEAYQARDWETAAAVLHQDAVVVMPATNERLTGRASVVEFQRSYPEPWGDLRVVHVVADRGSAAAEIAVVAAEATYRMAAFWRVGDGLLCEGIEYWITVGGEEPPPERAHGRD